jgi:magnesium and cobalt transporter
MAEEHGSTGRWLRRITDTLSGEPRDIDGLIETLTQARERGLINADAFEMLEGVLRVAELQGARHHGAALADDDRQPRRSAGGHPADRDRVGHSRFPVIGEDRDQVVGILLAKDLLRYFAEGGRETSTSRSACARSRSFPESKRLNVLLKEFRVSHHHMAIVGRRVRRRRRPGHDRRRAGADRRRHRRRVRRRGRSRHPQGRRAPVHGQGADAHRRVQPFFGTEFSDEEFDTIGGLAMNFSAACHVAARPSCSAAWSSRSLRADRRRLDMLRVITPRDIAPPTE